MKEENLVYDTSDEDADVFKKAKDDDDEVDGYESVVSKIIKPEIIFVNISDSDAPFIKSEVFYQLKI